MLQIQIGPDGLPINSRIVQTSGHPALDQAALRVVSEMKFLPAKVEADAVSTWVELPISFGEPPPRMRQRSPDTTALEGLAVATTSGTLQRMQAAETRAPTADRRTTPSMTPFTQRPQLINAQETQRALVRHYPAELRDAGLGGTVVLWLFVDVQGEVTRTQIHTTSGFASLDNAALDVAKVMRFNPALNRETPVGVWFELPVRFTAR
jgi:TonB family protein